MQYIFPLLCLLQNDKNESLNDSKCCFSHILEFKLWKKKFLCK